MTLNLEPAAADGDGTPVIDIEHRRLVLPRHLVPIGLLLLDGRLSRDRQGISAGLDQLEAAGIAAEGKIHPIARSILAPIADPAVVISINFPMSTTREIATVWRRGQAATVGTSRDRARFELCPIEADLIPFHLAALANLRVRPIAELEPIEIAADALAAVTRAVPASTEAAWSILRAVGLTDRAIKQLLDLQSPMARRWSVTTLWSEPDGFVGENMVEIIDGGPEGYWEVSTITADEKVIFTPRTLDAVLRLLADTASGSG